MHGAAVYAQACVERAPMRVEAREGRQQGRVDIDHPASPLSNKPMGQEAHVAGKADDFRAEFVERCIDRHVMRLAAVMVALDYSSRRNAEGFGCLEPGGVGAVGNDANDFSWISSFLRSLDQSRHVGAAA